MDTKENNIWERIKLAMTEVNMSPEDLLIWLEGKGGEKTIRKVLKKLGFTIRQIDWMAEKDGVYLSNEVKHQERWLKNDPKYPNVDGKFDGHGLPPNQVNFDIKMNKILGITPVLWVCDKTTHDIYYNSMVKLNSGDKYVTNRNPRVIFPINAFKVLEDNITETEKPDFNH